MYALFMRRIVLFAAVAAGCSEPEPMEDEPVPFDAVIRAVAECEVGLNPDFPPMVQMTAHHAETGQPYDADEVPCLDGTVDIEVAVDLTGIYHVEIVRGMPGICEADVNVHEDMSVYTVACD